MKKICYIVSSLAHKRVFECFKDVSFLNQLIVSRHPESFKLSEIEYKTFNIKKVKYFRSKQDLQNIINSFKPDIYVQCDLSDIHSRVKVKNNCKKIYVHHGTTGNHVLKLYGKKKLKVWQGFDLYFGLTYKFAEAISFFAKVSKDKIIRNCLPQFDIIYKLKKMAMLEKNYNPKAKKTILFIGFSGKDRSDFKYNNEDYYKTAIQLEKIAKKNNWLIMIKPRHEHKRNIDFLKGKKWGKKYIKDYNNLYNSKFVNFIETSVDIYKHYSADIFVINGTTTAELEACCINKPLFVVRTSPKSQPQYYDPYDSVKYGAGSLINDISKLEEKLLNYKKYHKPENQKKLLKDKNILFDGKHCERIQETLLKL